MLEMPVCLFDRRFLPIAVSVATLSIKAILASQFSLVCLVGIVSLGILANLVSLALLVSVVCLSILVILVSFFYRFYHFIGYLPIL